MVENVTNIEARVEQSKIASIEIGATIGNIRIANPADFELIALRLARAGVAVPVHCRDKAGTVFALCMQALEWGMPILSVINKSYVVENRGVERIAYESQLIHAVIERNAPLKGRLRYEILGEGDDRRCKVWATFRGEDKPHEYLSETLGKLRDARGRNDKGQVKGSPLWDAQPDVQLFYSASRQWARLFCPDVILGAYTPEDPQWTDASTMAVDVTPPSKAEEYASKLREARASRVAADRGFDPDHVQTMASERSTIIEGEVNPEKEMQDGRSNEPDTGGRQGGPAGGEVRDRDQGGSDQDGGDAEAVRKQPAGEKVAGAQGSDQKDVFPPDRKPQARKPSPKGKR